MDNTLILSQIPLDTLLSAFQSIIRTEIQNHTTTPAQDEDELLTSKQAAKILGVSLVTLHHWKIEGFVKFHRINTRIRFKKSELLEALQTTKKYGRK